MDEIANTFGFDWAKFLAQVIIFLSVYWVLNKYAFGPILSMLEQRRQRIAEGEANLDKIRKDLNSAQEKAGEIVAGANKDAERLIVEARESAEHLAEQKRKEASHEASQIIAKAREAGELEHEKLLSELKRDFGRLVVDTTSKVTGKVLTDDDQKRISEETAGQISL